MKSAKEIQNAVDRAYLLSNIIKSKHVNLTKMVKELGFKVVPMYVLPSSVLAIMDITTDNHLIGVNMNYDYAHRRFAVAHEIGHYIMHADKKKNDRLYIYQKDDEFGEEGEACKFATFLLLDEKIFNMEYKIYKKEENYIKILSKLFGAPMMTVKRRIKELNLEIT